MVYNGKLFCQSKGLWIICFFKITGELFIKKGKVENDPLVGNVNPHPRKMFQGLDIHVLEVTHFGKLGPERNVQRQGHLQGPFNIRMGHDPHGCGLAVWGKG